MDLTILAGEHVAITGPSGSGKSTPMNLLGCLDTPSSGTYRLDGEDVSGLKDDALAEIRNRKVGFVFQTFNLSRFTALANVELPLSMPGWRPRRAASGRTPLQVGLLDRKGTVPRSSGGQRQRVAVARALVVNPRSSWPTDRSLTAGWGEEIRSSSSA